MTTTQNIPDPLTHHYIGRTHTGARVFVTMLVARREVTMTTTAHEQVEGITRISIAGHLVSKGCRSVSAFGQIRSALANIIEYAPGWTEIDVVALAGLWQDWHMNDLESACEHMDLAGLGEDYDSRKHLVCPVTGYRYGQAWLYRAPTRAVLDQAARLQSLPTGHIPAYV